MTTFIRLLTDKDKDAALLSCCTEVRTGKPDKRLFEVEPESFHGVPGAPFAYWVSQEVRQVFERFPSLENSERTARQGLATAEDFRFVRAWWEEPGDGWYGFAKGGIFSPFYADIYLMAKWSKGGAEIKSGICKRYPYLNGNAEFVAKNPQFYLRPGITWPRRTNGLSFRIMPSGCIFADKGPAAFVTNDEPDDLLALCALVNSQAFGLLVSVQLARVELAQSFEVGLIQQTPLPKLSEDQRSELACLTRRAWSIKRLMDSTNETSHAFTLPRALQNRLSDFDFCRLHKELVDIHSKIDEIAFELYGFSEADQVAARKGNADPAADGTDADEDQNFEDAPEHDSLLSWVVGVTFGRFDWRLVTGDRVAPQEPEPFDPLATKSDGMLPDDAEPFHSHNGILTDDEGHDHDLPRLMERVLGVVGEPVNEDLRRWLRKNFFSFHLRGYSRSRRKAPIYWPLSTVSGDYTLWLYYPELNSQTLFTAVNDFVEPKLHIVRDSLMGLRSKGTGRSKQEERELEELENFEQELADLRDTLLNIAPGYRPQRSDGVQISASPLWSLFRNTQWQKALKETWRQLEEGDYDWAHLALNYWPERVLQKCAEDRSIAIAHDVEELFWEEVEVPVIRRGHDTGETRLDWEARDLSETEIAKLTQEVIDNRGLRSESW